MKKRGSRSPKKKTVKTAAARKGPAKPAATQGPARGKAGAARAEAKTAKPPTYAPKPIEGMGWAPFRYPPA